MKAECIQHFVIWAQYERENQKKLPENHRLLAFSLIKCNVVAILPWIMPLIEKKIFENFSEDLCVCSPIANFKCKTPSTNINRTHQSNYMKQSSNVISYLRKPLLNIFQFECLIKYVSQMKLFSLMARICRRFVWCVSKNTHFQHAAPDYVANSN